MLRISVFLQGKQSSVAGFGNVRALDSPVYLKMEVRWGMYFELYSKVKTDLSYSSEIQNIAAAKWFDSAA